MFRFFVTTKTAQGFVLDANVIKHLRVIRGQSDNFICVYQERFFVCHYNPQTSIAEIVHELPNNNELARPVTLAACIIETKGWEFILQKATELGVATIMPVLSQHIANKKSDFASKQERWQKIVTAAAEQAFRNVVPQVTKVHDFTAILKLDFPHKYIAHEKSAMPVRDFFPQDSLFLVGPEGGFSDEEISQAIKHGFEVVSLGKRILRAETASMALLAKVKQ